MYKRLHWIFLTLVGNVSNKLVTVVGLVDKATPAGALAITETGDPAPTLLLTGFHPRIHDAA